MQSKAKTVKEYLAELPKDRRNDIEAVRSVIRKYLPKGFEQGMQYGMIGYYIPHSIYPAGYHCDPKQPLPYAALASQRNYMSIYLLCVFASSEHEKWFRKEWAKTGKKLDMGKGCVRFKTLDDLPLGIIGATIARMPVKECISYYEAVREMTGKRGRSKARAAAKKSA